jgi:hypothetical protein
MSELNSFQIECEKRLIEVLNRSNCKLFNRRIEGINEQFITGELSVKNLKVFIYNDGAEISGPNVDERFESAAYDSLNDLRDSFIKKVVKLLSQ